MKHILTAMLLLAFAAVASAQNYYAPESPRIPEFGRWQPVYRQPVQTPGPWYTVTPENDRWLPGSVPLPTGPIGTVRYWTGNGWSQPYWYQPAPSFPRCYCY